MIILLALLCLFSNSYPENKTGYNLKRTGYQFQQALAQLYTQKPHLLRPHYESQDTQEINYNVLDMVFNYGATGVPLTYFSYGTVNNLIDYSNTRHQFQESMINQVLMKFFPSLFINSPRIIGLFLQETELLLQAYLLKLMLKLIIFCFFKG